jgi:hypothetical protein
MSAEELQKVILEVFQQQLTLMGLPDYYNGELESATACPKRSRHDLRQTRME